MAPWFWAGLGALGLTAGTVAGVVVRIREIKSKERIMNRVLDGTSPEQRVQILKSAPAVLRELGSQNGMPGDPHQRPRPYGVAQTPGKVRGRRF